MTTKDFQTRGLLRIFLSYFKPHRRLFALDMTCAFLIAVVDLAFPLVSRTALYTWLPEKQFRVFFIVMAAVVAAYVVRSGLYFVVAYWGHTFGIRVEADIRRDLYHHMQELGFDFYDKNRTGQLMSRLTSDLFEVTELAHHGPEDIFISGVTIVGALAIMFTIQWQLALVIACIIPVFFLVVWKCRKSMQDASIKVKQRTATINADIESGLSGIKTAKAYSAVLEASDYTDVDYDQATFTTIDRIVKADDKGYVVTTTFSGAQGSITMAVGVDTDMKCTGISIISHAETSGLGAKAAAASEYGDWWRGQFVGTGDDVSLTKYGGTIDSITAATITSNAVAGAVAESIKAVESLG